MKNEKVRLFLWSIMLVVFAGLIKFGVDVFNNQIESYNYNELRNYVRLIAQEAQLWRSNPTVIGGGARGSQLGDYYDLPVEQVLGRFKRDNFEFRVSPQKSDLILITAWTKDPYVTLNAFVGTESSEISISDKDEPLATFMDFPGWLQDKISFDYANAVYNVPDTLLTYGWEKVILLISPMISGADLVEHHKTQCPDCKGTLVREKVDLVIGSRAKPIWNGVEINVYPDREGSPLVLDMFYTKWEWSLKAENTGLNDLSFYLYEDGRLGTDITSLLVYDDQFNIHVPADTRHFWEKLKENKIAWITIILTALSLLVPLIKRFADGELVKQSLVLDLIEERSRAIQELTDLMKIGPEYAERLYSNGGVKTKGEFMWHCLSDGRMAILSRKTNIARKILSSAFKHEEKNSIKIINELKGLTYISLQNAERLYYLGSIYSKEDFVSYCQTAKDRKKLSKRTKIQARILESAYQAERNSARVV